MKCCKQVGQFAGVCAAAGLVVWGLLAFSGNSSGQQKLDKQAQLEQNKANAVAFYKMAFNDHKPAEAIEKYVGKQYKQHNPNAADGKQPFIDFVSKYAKTNPGLRIDVKRVIAEGDLVVVHVHVRTSDKDRGMAAIDIFRMEDGKVVEHWDAVQPVPEKSANDNTMF